MHFLPFQYILCAGFIFYIKAARFKALKQQYPVIVIILPSEQEQSGFGGSFLFSDVSSEKAISAALLSLCAQQHFCCRGCGRRCQGSGHGSASPGVHLLGSRASTTSALSFPECIHGHSHYLLRDCFSVPWKALRGHVGVTAILRQGVLQGNKWEQRLGRPKSWRTQFIFFIHRITELLN